MKIIPVLIILLLANGCITPPGKSTANNDHIHSAFFDGNFQLADSLIAFELSNKAIPNELKKEYIILQAKMERIVLDFKKNEDQIIQELQQVYSGITSPKLSDWENSGQLEMRLINGVKKYFKYAVNNLYRVNAEAGKKRDSIFGPRSDGLDRFCIEEAESVINNFKANRSFKKRNWHIQFTITVPSGVVPEGEMIKCWMPFPKPNQKRLMNIELIRTSQDEFLLSVPTSPQRSLYMEAPAQAELPVKFEYEIKFSSQAEWYDPQKLSFKPYSIHSDIFVQNTQVQEPHIVFSKEVKQLADSLTTGLTNPLEIVQALYFWMSKEIPWASALEYSTFECIPDYVIRNKKGDCGMVSFLFLSMARYKGIPCKWQSGWMLHPGYKNLHDWVEVYYEGIGWIPLDMSFGLMPSSLKNIHEFYMTGIDAYRMIVNDAISAVFNPVKEFYRSEPFDFQRGEIEWSGGNLYFNQWDYSLQIIDTHEE